MKSKEEKYPETKTVMTPSGEPITMVRADSNIYGCCGCYTSIQRNDYIAACPDCAAVFCEKCVADGTFDAHECDEDDDEDWEEDET